MTFFSNFFHLNGWWEGQTPEKSYFFGKFDHGASILVVSSLQGHAKTILLCCICVQLSICLIKIAILKGLFTKGIISANL